MRSSLAITWALGWSPLMACRSSSGDGFQWLRGSERERVCERTRWRRRVRVPRRFSGWFYSVRQGRTRPPLIGEGSDTMEMEELVFGANHLGLTCQ
jgi:hypothetical protein